MKEHGYRRNRIVRRSTTADIELLAGVDEAHETVSGLATLKILYREVHDSGDARYQRLSTISLPYNLQPAQEPRVPRTEDLLPEDEGGWRSAHLKKPVPACAFG